MKKIFFIHFNEEELKEKIQPLKKPDTKSIIISVLKLCLISEMISLIYWLFVLTGFPLMAGTMQNGCGKERNDNRFPLFSAAASLKR